MNAPAPFTQDRFTYLKEQLTLPRPSRRWQKLALAWAALSGGVVLIVGYFISHSLERWGGAWLFLGGHEWLFCVGGVGVLAFFIGPTVALAYHGNQLDKKHWPPLVDELVRLDDPRAVGVLLTLPDTVSSWEAESSYDSCPPEIQQALIRLLPRLQHADAVHLPVRIIRGGLSGPVNAQDRLHALLRDENEELVVAVLIALAQVGTLGALPFVEPLTKGRRGPHIQAAAQRCYAVLAERADKVKEPETLLRAASAPGGVLLRPALPVAEPAAEELLRVHPPQSLS